MAFVVTHRVVVGLGAGHQHHQQHVTRVLRLLLGMHAQKRGLQPTGRPVEAHVEG